MLVALHRARRHETNTMRTTLIQVEMVTQRRFEGQWQTNLLREVR